MTPTPPSGEGRRNDEELRVPDLSALRTWLETHHSDDEGLWLVTGKKGTDAYIAYPDLVREVLRVGWVDSQPRTVDETHTARRISPRRPGSSWSRVNKTHIAALEAAGDLHPAGRAAVERSRADGSWAALDAVEDLIEPTDLASALDRDPTARRHWDTFPRSTKRAILEWISTAKAAPTRDKRITETVAEASIGRRANQWRQPKKPGP